MRQVADATGARFGVSSWTIGPEPSRAQLPDMIRHARTIVAGLSNPT